MDTADDAGPGAPVFFLSYSQAVNQPAAAGPRQPDGNVLRFFDDLSSHVGQLVGSETGADPGFLDRSMDGGQEWEAELLRMVRTAHVLVPLISMPYLHSPWCAAEWNIFSRRPVRSRELSDTAVPTTRAILPVKWSSTGRARVPNAISKVQRFYPTNLRNLSINVQYQQEGIYGLLAMNDKSAYQPVVWRVAQRVADIYHSYRVMQGDDVDPEKADFTWDAPR